MEELKKKSNDEEEEEKGHENREGEKITYLGLKLENKFVASKDVTLKGQKTRRETMVASLLVEAEGDWSLKRRYILCTVFSTTSALTDWSSVFYSVIYTSVPTIIVGILDKDLSHKTLLQYPKLYGAGHRQESYNSNLFWMAMIDTHWQSLVLFYIPLFSYMNSTIDIWSMGSLWTISVVVLVNVHLAMDIQCWVLITHVATWGSIIITYICMVILDSIPIFPNYWAIYHLVTTATYWLTILLIIVVALLPHFLFKVVRRFFWPSDIQIAREAEILGKLPNQSQSKPDQDTS